MNNIFSPRPWGFGSNFVQYAFYLKFCERSGISPVVNFYLNPISPDFNIFEYFEVSKKVTFFSEKRVYFSSRRSALFRLLNFEFGLLDILKICFTKELLPEDFLYGEGQDINLFCEENRGVLVISEEFSGLNYTADENIRECVVHLRGGDKNKERRDQGSFVPGISSYTAKLEEMASLGVKRFYFIGDDGLLLQGLLDYLNINIPQVSVLISEFFIYGGHDQVKFNVLSVDSKMAGFIAFMKDATRASKADYFIGDHNSNMFHVVQLFSEKCITLCVNGGKGYL